MNELGDVRVARLLLDAMYATPRDGGCMQFIVRKPGEHWLGGGLGAEVHLSANGMLRAAIALREVGAEKWRVASVEELHRVLADVIIDTYWTVCEGNWARAFDTSYATRVSHQQVTQLASEIRKSSLFTSQQFCSVFNLATISVDDVFQSEEFFLSVPHKLSSELLRVNDSRLQLMPTQFPPVKDYPIPTSKPTSWLGIHSSSTTIAVRKRNAILGAMCLAAHDVVRYQFCQKAVPGTYASFEENCLIHFIEPHTPALCKNIKIAAHDHGWLQKLGELLRDSALPARKRVRALEYQYRAWGYPPVERFPILCMALDAVFGVPGQVTKSIVSAVVGIVGMKVRERISRLMKLRNEVVHGDAPDLYDSDQYFSYFRDYSIDPVDDLQIISAHCLRAHVFDGAMNMQPNPHLSAK